MKMRHLVIALFTSLMCFTPITQAKILNLINSTIGTSNITPNRIIINAPDIAENGAVVPMSIKKIKLETTTNHVTEIWFFSDSYHKAIAHFKFAENAIVEGIATRIKMSQSGMLYAVARLSDGRFISGKKTVKVTIGGCGGGGSTASYISPHAVKQYQRLSFAGKNVINEVSNNYHLTPYIAAVEQC